MAVVVPTMGTLAAAVAAAAVEEKEERTRIAAIYI